MSARHGVVIGYVHNTARVLEFRSFIEICETNIYFSDEMLNGIDRFPCELRLKWIKTPELGRQVYQHQAVFVTTHTGLVHRNVVEIEQVGEGLNDAVPQRSAV